MTAHVYILATLDTKGLEAAFVRDRLRSLGVSAVLVDTGSLGAPQVPPDITAAEVFAAVGIGVNVVRANLGRAEAVARAAAGAVQVACEKHAAGDLAGVLGLGGGAGTSIGTAAMRALPLGVPKLMVSTLASGQTRQYVGEKDILMLNAVVDMAGLNSISRLVLDQAARAMAGLVNTLTTATAWIAKPQSVGVTMFGLTMPGVQHACRILEAAGYEVLVFHATGSGGRTMESLIRDGRLVGVLDITTTELADEIVGGFLTAGSDRLTAAGQMGIPQVVSVGATDMVNFYGIETVPERFRDRRLHHHDTQVTLMRTTPEENARIGADIGRKLAAARGAAAIYLPRLGVSRLDAVGEPFDDTAARAALFDAIRAHAGDVSVIELDQHINDAAFTEAAALRLIELLGMR